MSSLILSRGLFASALLSINVHDQKLTRLHPVPHREPLHSRIHLVFGDERKRRRSPGYHLEVIHVLDTRPHDMNLTADIPSIILHFPMDPMTICYDARRAAYERHFLALFTLLQEILRNGERHRENSFQSIILCATLVDDGVRHLHPFYPLQYSLARLKPKHFPLFKDDARMISTRQSSHLSFTAQYTRSKLFNLRFKETEPVIIRATSLQLNRFCVMKISSRVNRHVSRQRAEWVFNPGIFLSSLAGSV
ncbi:uncharacterized protein ARMOST_20182 [Armillaria ostoyae]|uniref:Uncharacterized protein n=1 Tax=Armillaria ostoyae TaxID=47428 RepID=A0A284S6M9_ARMOS|nr:uncharacterized protein ARMOST_20182 [Armillaria ostoyae]